MRAVGTITDSLLIVNRKDKYDDLRANHELRY